MKNARIGLLVLSVFAFAKMECKSSQTSSKNSAVKKSTRSAKPQKRGVAQRRVAQSSRPVVVEEDSHKIEVKEEMLQPGQVVQASVDTHVTENTEDNTITEVTVTVTPMPEEGKVVTTKETWTWKDYTTLAVGATVVAGATYAAHQYYTNPTFAGQVNDTGSWASEQANSAYQAGSQALASGYEKTKTFSQDVGQSLDNAWQSTTQKANDVSQEVKSKWSNWRSRSIPAPTAPEVSAPAESSSMNESNPQEVSGQVNDTGSWASEQASNAYQAGSQALASGYEKAKAFGQEVSRFVDTRLKDSSNRLGDASITTGGDL